MGKLAAVTCESAKPDKGRDRLLGDGDGLFLRVRQHGTTTWLIEYEFNAERTKYTIGVYDREGAQGDSIPDWLRHGRFSLTQARESPATGRRTVGRHDLADRPTLPAVSCMNSAARSLPACPTSASSPSSATRMPITSCPACWRTYNHNAYEAREAALKTWAERIEALAKGKNVVQLQRGTACLS